MFLLELTELSLVSKIIEYRTKSIACNKRMKAVLWTKRKRNVCKKNEEVRFYLVQKISPVYIFGRYIQSYELHSIKLTIFTETKQGELGGN